MSYIKATDVLPQNIIEIIQQYIDGENIYIPRKESEHTVWGEKSGAREEMHRRNVMIYREYLSGTKTGDLADRYFLSEKSIQRIIRTMKNEEPA